ncbi:MAG: MFS transporter [Planctomycetaceae bacterium]
MLLIMPAVVTLLRQHWGEWLGGSGVTGGYLVIFLIGNALQLVTIVPLLRVHDLPIDDWRDGGPAWRELVTTCRTQPNLRWIILSAWWLAFAQGLTQAPFFRYQVNVLHQPIETYLLLSGLMYGLQIPLSTLGGWLSDHSGDRGPTMFGLLLVSLAMLFWFLARPGQSAWLIGAYATWGLFGLVNVCQRNLLLRHARHVENATPLAALEQISGLLAGVAGLTGGWLLDQLLARLGTSSPLMPYFILFGISWFGRATAPLWLLPVRRQE